MRCITRALAALLLVAAATATPGCQRPDLVISALEATAAAPDRVEFTVTVTNRDYTGSVFERPGPVSGPIYVHTWTSSDGTSLDAPAAVPFAVVFAGETLHPGQFRAVNGSAAAGIDLDARPYLILIVDQRELTAEHDHANDSRTVLIERPD